MAIQIVNVEQKFRLITQYWDPKIAGELNGQQIRLAKLKGSFDWHHHAEEDEMFYIVAGVLEMHLRDQILTLHQGEFVIIPRGVEHKPVAAEEVHVMLFEPATTLNTGTEVTARTVQPQKI